MLAGSRLPPRLLGCLLLAACLGDSCPPKWLYFRDYCYGFFQQRLTWDEAEEECELYGPMGHLASVHDKDVSDTLALYLASQSQATDNVWIGLQN
uniref:C-type lectin domain-containing protein n=1 Tax=Amazona collaria TaxID=241587 RepID=A0A8B9F4Y1_9PSIT